MKNLFRSLISTALLAAPVLAPRAAHAGGLAEFRTSADTIPNFAYQDSIRSKQSGKWSETTTWDDGRVPNSSDIVYTTHTLTFDVPSGDVDVIGIDAGGALKFDTTQSRVLRVGTILVMPGGELEIGTESAPVPPAVTMEIVIKNKPLNSLTDMNQFGTGILSVSGKVVMHGAVKTPTFVRLSQAPAVGDGSFSFAQPVSGWRAGDLLVVPDSRQRTNGDDRISYKNLEVRRVQSLAADQRSVTFSPVLQFAHPGTTDENNDTQPDYLPHAANLTRNIHVRSETRTGTRGHVLFTARAHIDIRYAAFEGLGRTTFNDLNAVTNHIGRYSLHIHHLMGPSPTVDPQYQFRLVGNSVYEDAPDPPPQKWGITVHNSHYGLIKDNVVFNVGGAAYVTEDGSESFNHFDHNFAAKVSSNGGRDEHEDQPRGIAREGVGFWFRGPNNYVRNNVAANMGESTGDVEASYAFKYNMTYVGNVRVPNFRGADTSTAGQYTTKSGYTMHILEFDKNEGYGLVQGLTIWWHCLFGSSGYGLECGGQAVIRDMVIWHAMRYAYYGYPGYNYIFDGVKVYGSKAEIDADQGYNAIWWYGDYETVDHVLKNSFFYNSDSVYTPYFRNNFMRFENNFIKTRSGVNHRTSASPGAGCSPCSLPDVNSVLLNNKFAAPAGHPLRSITMDFYTSGQDSSNMDRLFACNHNGQPGNNFEVFFPEKGNAPCATTLPDVDGYACVTALSASVCGSAPPLDTTPPARPKGLRVK